MKGSCETVLFILPLFIIDKQGNLEGSGKQISADPKKMLRVGIHLSMVVAGGMQLIGRTNSTEKAEEYHRVQSIYSSVNKPWQSKSGRT